MGKVTVVGGKVGMDVPRKTGFVTVNVESNSGNDVFYWVDLRVGDYLITTTGKSTIGVPLGSIDIVATLSKSNNYEFFVNGVDIGLLDFSAGSASLTKTVEVSDGDTINIELITF